MSARSHFSRGGQLTPSQRESLRDALSSARKGESLTLAQREAVRALCHATGDVRRSPERCLAVFKSCLNEAASEAGMPLGRERTKILERFVSLFIDEMYRLEAPEPVDDTECRGKAASGIIPAESRGLPDAQI